MTKIVLMAKVCGVRVCSMDVLMVGVKVAFCTTGMTVGLRDNARKI